MEDGQYQFLWGTFKLEQTELLDTVIMTFHLQNLTSMVSVVLLKIDLFHIWIIESSLYLLVTFTLIRKVLLVVFLRSLSVCGLCSKKTTEDSHVIYVNNQVLTRETSIRCLAIYIDSNLNWKSRINCILKKVKRSVGILFKLLYYLNSKTLVDLQCAFVYPSLTYCIVACGNT